MGLAGDLIEVKKLWKKSSLLSRCLLALSTLLAISSVASLSDIIFHWKGFIKDGINFYNSWITGSIIRYATEFGFSLNEKNLNYVIILTLLHAGLIRVFIYGQSYKNYLIIAITMFNYLNMVKMYLFDTIIIDGWIMFFAPIALASPFLLFTPLRIKVIYFGPIVISIFIVLILAAINSGLNREL